MNKPLYPSNKSISVPAPFFTESAMGASRIRRSALLSHLDAAQSAGVKTPVTVFGLSDAQGNGTQAVLAYAQVSSRAELSDYLKQNLGINLHGLDAVAGFVTQQHLEANPNNPAWSGMADIWPEFEPLLPGPVRNAVNSADTPPALSFCQVYQVNFY